ncbi:MAG: hypothetical protein SGI74_05545 [Oligoflexia bacterium]|nr:hypothetical protein [Oligoflexia bacterium]
MLQLRSVHLLIVSATVVVCAGFPIFAQNSKDDKADKMRQRLEQLFVWRVSDRLQLTPTEEIKFNSEFKKISDKKTQVSNRLESLLDQLEKKKSDTATSTKLLKEYQEVLKQHNALQSNEMEVMGKMFGHKKLVEYVLLKKEMTQKFKDVLTHGQTKAVENKTFKDPEVIQEK